jgi:FAD-dependent urate hydroxylase
MSEGTSLLIIGAGPYGLAMAAYCRDTGIDYRLLGEPMSFWKSHMPAGMYLRSRHDWHLDPFERRTIERYLRAKKIPRAGTLPLSLRLYLDYAAWFQAEEKIVADPRLVRHLTRTAARRYPFEVRLSDGDVLRAENVLIAIGFGMSAHVPPELAHLVPSGRLRHAQDCIDFERLAGKSCLIIGGRQSAFEWAALAGEAGAARIHVSHRHASPDYALADWSWVNPLLDRMLDEPGWYRRLTQGAKQEIIQHMWRIGRLRVEPWLGPRLASLPVTFWPDTQLTDCRSGPDGRLEIELNAGTPLAVDEVLVATGYRTDVRRLPFLARSNILEHLAIDEGYPELSDHFESSVAGLYFTNRFASRQFGNFFDFTAGARVAARLIGRALSRPSELVPVRVSGREARRSG